MLPDKWYADNSDKEQYTKEEMHRTCPKSTEDYPDKIEHQCQATSRMLGVVDLCAERP